MDLKAYSSFAIFQAEVKKKPLGFSDVENLSALVFVGCLPPKTLQFLKNFSEAVDTFIGALPEDSSERMKDPLYEKAHRMFYQLAEVKAERGKESLPETTSLLPIFDAAIEGLFQAINDRSAYSTKQSCDHAKRKGDAYRLAGATCLSWAFQKYCIPDFGG